MKITLPRKTRLLLQIRAAAAALAAAALWAYLGSGVSPAFFIPAELTVALYPIVAFYYIPRFVNGVYIYLSTAGVAVKYGVFIKTEQILPALRAVYTQTRQTPLAKAMGLCAVSFSGARAKIRLPEIPKTDAERLLREYGFTEGGEKDG